MPRKTKKSIGSGKTLLPDFIVNQFFGLNTAAKNTDELNMGESPNALNWITGANYDEKTGKYYGDHIEMRRGTAFLKGSAMAGTTPVSGLGVGIQKSGTQIPFFSVGQKIYYYDKTNNVYTEVGSNALPAGAKNDDVAIIPYQSITGYYVQISSPNSSIYRIAVANPGNIIDFKSLEERGYIIMNQGRTFLWNRIGTVSGQDSVNLYISYADAATYSSPSITQATGIVKNATDGTTKTFTGNLSANITTYANAFGIQIAAPTSALVNVSAVTKASNGQVTTSAAHGLSVGDIVVFANIGGMTQLSNLIASVVSVIDTTNFTISTDTTTFGTYTSGGTMGKSEQFTDDQNGNLASSAGGTGTINYVTGAYSVTFNTAPINGQNLVAAIYRDLPTNQGVAQFTLGTPTAASQGDFIPQQGFGSMMNVLPLSGLYFCFHQFGTYQLYIYANDVTNSQTIQQIYRNTVGIPYWRGAYATSDGIIYIDTLNSSGPKLRMLVFQYSLSTTNPAIIPKSISDQIDFTNNDFTKVIVYEWGDYYVLECKGLTNGVADANNDVMYVRNKKTGYFDKLDYRANCLANYSGALIAGDSIAPNPLILFSGFDDLGYNIPNFWQSPFSFLGQQGLKRFNRLVVKGYIQPSQSLDIYLAYDFGQFVKIGTIAGNSQYVNQGVPHEVGGMTVGSNIVGGGGTQYAYPFEREFKIGSDLFNRVALQAIGSSVGYLEIDEYVFKDIRYKSRRILPVLSD